jgi:hypothetical protein
VGVRHRVAAVAVSLPLVLGVAACADVALDTDSSKPAATKPAVAPIKAAPPVRLTKANFSRTTDAAGAKVKSVESVARYSYAGQVVTMKLTQIVKPVAMTLDFSSPAYGGAAHIVIVKDTLYLAATNVAPGGKYVKVNLKTTKDPQLAAIGEMVENADPTKAAKVWSKGLRQVKFVKSETIGFRKVDRYQLTVATNALLGLNKLPAGLPKTTLFTVWLGADHLPYKTSYRVGTTDTQVTISGYNTVDPIAAPPASKIFRR